jgi:CubicO group peptidase (beta-lactamase class C family)
LDNENDILRGVAVDRKLFWRSSVSAFALFLFLFALPPIVAVHAAGRHFAHSVKKLTNATAGQDRRFADAFVEVNKWVDQKAFPGAVLAVGQHGQIVALKAFGKMDSTALARPMSVGAVFDLASLTKVTGTTTAAEILYDRKKLDLDAPVTKYIPEFAGKPGRDKILVRNLLTHSSGLNSLKVLWKQANDRQGIIGPALQNARRLGTGY